MKIADLFINLGIKDTGNTEKSLKNVKGTLGDISSTALAMKAALLAAMYGLEHMMSKSAAMGTSLVNFNALTGMSTKTLQQWEYAAIQAGTSAEDMDSSFKAAQLSMTNMLLGKGAPEALGFVASKVGLDIARARKDLPYLMTQLQAYAQSVPADIARATLSSFGLSEGVMAGMRRGIFNQNTFNRAPTFSAGEIAMLDRANIVWKNIGRSIEMAFGHLTAKHGLAIAKDFANLITQVTHLADAFLKLIERLKVFQAISESFKGIGMLFNLVSTGAGAVNALLGSKDKGDQAALKSTAETWNLLPQTLMEIIKTAGQNLVEDRAGMAGLPTRGATNQNTSHNVNLTQHFHGAQNPEDIAKHTHKTIQQHYTRASRQIPTQAGGF